MKDNYGKIVAAAKNDLANQKKPLVNLEIIREEKPVPKEPIKAVLHFQNVGDRSPILPINKAVNKSPIPGQKQRVNREIITPKLSVDLSGN